MSWNIRKLYHLADAENEIFADPKLARAYAAMARHDLLVDEPRPDEQSLVQELTDALAALDQTIAHAPVANPLLSRLAAEMSQHVPEKPPAQTEADADEDQDMDPEPGT